ncbi:hypothetical protein JCM10213_006136 [Rhodosporidiobolus nylandii]
MAQPDEDVDYYALLGVSAEATLQQIKTAYRKESLKVHPDRNPDNPEAAHLFHQLNSAFTLLSDPQERSKLDTKLAAQQAKKARFAALDNKRKAMAADLEAREREFKRGRKAEEEEKGRKRGELERLKEEGRRLREERMAAAAASAAAAPAQKRESNEQATMAQDDLGPLDKTLKIKWLRAAHPALVSAAAVESLLSSLLVPSDPNIDSTVLSSKTLSALSPSSSSSTSSGGGKKDKPPKYGTGVVAFRTLSAAVRAMKGKVGDREGRWEGVELDWAGGGEPGVVRGEMERFRESLSAKSAGGGDKPTPSIPSFASAPLPPSASAPTPAPQPAASAPASEDSILAALRARERERERLMEEMRRQDEEEDAAGVA